MRRRRRNRKRGRRRRIILIRRQYTSKSFSCIYIGYISAYSSL
jgi:hypothetical protein